MSNPKLETKAAKELRRKLEERLVKETAYSFSITQVVLEVLDETGLLSNIEDKESVFEMADVTDEETYYTCGIWRHLSEAKEFLDSLKEPNSLGGASEYHEDFAKVEIRERRIGLSGQGRTVYARTWRQEYNAADDDFEWKSNIEDKPDLFPQSRSELIENLRIKGFGYGDIQTILDVLSPVHVTALLAEVVPLLEIVRDYEPGEPDGACPANRARAVIEAIQELLSGKSNENQAQPPVIPNSPPSLSNAGKDGEK